jgi:hypothetical protein
MIFEAFVRQDRKVYCYKCGRLSAARAPGDSGIGDEFVSGQGYPDTCRLIQEKGGV